MNNSYFSIEQANGQLANAYQGNEPLVSEEFVAEREGALLTIIEAIQQVKQTKGWAVLGDMVFDSLAENLEKELQKEAKKQTPDLLVLTRLSGQILWAEKYADLDKLETAYRNELTNLRRYGKSKTN